MPRGELESERWSTQDKFSIVLESSTLSEIELAEYCRYGKITITAKLICPSTLGIKAIHEGYKVTFISMGELIHVLKTREITRKSQVRLKRISTNVSIYCVTTGMWYFD